MNISVSIKQEENRVIGYLHARRTIVVDIEKEPKVVMSTTLPSNIEEAKTIIWLMKRTIEEAERIFAGAPNILA